jgi:V/A-type H+-transporting ATPase subunit E
MEVQVQELIDKIKKDGLDEARAGAAKLKADAEKEAAGIVEAAKKEAADIVRKAKEDADRSEKAGIAAVGQASRNVILSFKSEIQALLDKIVAAETAASFSADTLKKLLPEILKGWADGKGAVDVILSEKDCAELAGFFKDKLAGELKQGVELKSNRNLGAGFRIENKDGSAYYDFSAEAAAELLSAYLNPKLAETLKSEAKGA